HKVFCWYSNILYLRFMRNDSKPFDYICSFYCEVTDEDYQKLKSHYDELAHFHGLQIQWADSIRDETLGGRKIHLTSFALRKAFRGRHHSTTQLRMLFEADLKLIQQSLIVYDLEFFSRCAASIVILTGIIV